MRKQQQSKPTIAHDDATLHMFAGNLVLNTLQQALVITCLEDEVTPWAAGAVAHRVMGSTSWRLGASLMNTLSHHLP